MKLNVAMIGLGNISLLFDDDPHSKTILSHVKAIYLNQNFDLKYCVDIDTSNKNKVLNFFPNLLFYTDISELQSKNDIDILVIATPTATHYDIFKIMKQNQNIKYFLIEKPLFETGKDLDFIDENLSKKLIINYIRVFEPNIQKLKNKIDDKTYGLPQKIVLTYTKGIKNNGTHFVSLLNYLFNNPEISNIQVQSSQEGLSGDPTLDVVATMNYQNKKIPLYFIGLDNNKYSIFDIDFYFESAKIRIDDTKQTLLVEKAEQDSVYSSYITLKKEDTLTLDYNNIMKYPYEYINNLVHQKTTYIDFLEHEKNNIKFYKSLNEKES